MTTPTFDIQLATNTLNSRVSCNGEDISSSIRAVEITQTAGELPIVKLQLAVGPRGASFRLQGEALGFIIETRDTPLDAK